MRQLHAVRVLISLLLCAPIASPGSARAPIDAAAPIRQVLAKSGFEGEVLAGRGDQLILDTGATDNGHAGQPAIWRWASVTKQVIAVLVMQEVAAGRIVLDRTVATYLPGLRSPNAATMTVRQLLRHQTGLPNPDDTASTPDTVPAYYAVHYTGNRDPLTGYCAGPVKGAAGGAWSYNNCDYIVAGALLQAVAGKPWQTLVRERIARPLGLSSLGAFPTRQAIVRATVDGKPEPAYDIASFAASAGLFGSARDLWAFDRALMHGRLLPEAARAEMWDGQPSLGYIALGQWVFEASLKGCAKPVRIVERRGSIGGVEVRNFILPEKDIAVIAFSRKAPFEFGEIWQGAGFSHDLLSAAACAA